jgi:hypothetical protein
MLILIPIGLMSYSSKKTISVSSDLQDHQILGLKLSSKIPLLTYPIDLIVIKSFISLFRLKLNAPAASI